jgi:REP element-mobilizing transposase RayT
MLTRQAREFERQAQSIELGNLQNLLSKVENLELELVEEGVISDEGYYSDKIGEIKETIYKIIQHNKIDMGAGFQGNVVSDGMSGFRG